MSRGRGRREEPGQTLFDLPLAAETPPRHAPESRDEERPEALRETAGAAVPETPAAGAARRVRAALADLLAIASVGLGAVAGLRLLGVALPSSAWLGVGAMLLVFSYLYSLLPLAFWGQTPGMAWAGVRVGAADGSLPSFAQAHRIILAGLLTCLLLGLPALLLWSGRSLGDRWSGCQARRSGD
jgi:uncharacterized RDD family membrane protein YckC